jgi:hypothetical protein
MIISFIIVSGIVIVLWKQVSSHIATRLGRNPLWLTSPKVDSSNWVDEVLFRWHFNPRWATTLNWFIGLVLIAIMIITAIWFRDHPKVYRVNYLVFPLMVIGVIIASYRKRSYWITNQGIYDNLVTRRSPNRLRLLIRWEDIDEIKIERKSIIITQKIKEEMARGFYDLPSFIERQLARIELLFPDEEILNRAYAIVQGRCQSVSLESQKSLNSPGGSE